MGCRLRRDEGGPSLPRTFNEAESFSYLPPPGCIVRRRREGPPSSRLKRQSRLQQGRKRVASASRGGASSLSYDCEETHLAEPTGGGDSGQGRLVAASLCRVLVLLAAC